MRLIVNSLKFEYFYLCLKCYKNVNDGINSSMDKQFALNFASLYEKLLGMNILDTCDLINKIISIFKKAIFLPSQIKYFVANEHDIMKLSYVKS